MKVQQDMQSQLKAIRVEHKRKSSSKLPTATEELQFLMDFNSSICQAMAKSMEHLTVFVFVNMANVTLLRRDSYLAYWKAGIKADTLAALRTAPLHISTLFPDTVANPVHTAPRLSQKKELSPGLADSYLKIKLKYVKSASCVTQLSCVKPVTNVKNVASNLPVGARLQLSCVKPVTNVKNVASNLPVGARLQNFWQTLLDLGAGPKVVQILKEGYTLPFRIRSKLTRSQTVISCYVNPHRNLKRLWDFSTDYF